MLSSSSPGCLPVINAQRPTTHVTYDTHYECFRCIRVATMIFRAQDPFSCAGG